MTTDSCCNPIAEEAQSQLDFVQSDPIRPGGWQAGDAGIAAEFRLRSCSGSMAEEIPGAFRGQQRWFGHVGGRRTRSSTCTVTVIQLNRLGRAGASRRSRRCGDPDLLPAPVQAPARAYRARVGLRPPPSPNLAAGRPGRGGAGPQRPDRGRPPGGGHDHRLPSPSGLGRAGPGGGSADGPHGPSLQWSVPDSACGDLLMDSLIPRPWSRPWTPRGSACRPDQAAQPDGHPGAAGHLRCRRFRGHRRSLRRSCGTWSGTSQKR